MGMRATSATRYQMRVWCVAFVMWALVVVGAASAAELAGITMPESISVGEKTLVLNGLGLREATFLKFDVFVGGLYLEQKTHDPNKIIQSQQMKQVAMHFVRNVDAEDLRNAWTKGFEKNVGGNFATLSDRVDQLNGWMAKMQVGDRMTFSFDRNGVDVNVKGSQRGTISGKDFSRTMLSIWFGPKPPNEGLKRGMLGVER